MVQEWKCAEYDGQEERIIKDTIEMAAWMKQGEGSWGSWTWILELLVDASASRLSDSERRGFMLCSFVAESHSDYTCTCSQCGWC
jgi:hypothetical protein